MIEEGVCRIAHNIVFYLFQRIDTCGRDLEAKVTITMFGEIKLVGDYYSLGCYPFFASPAKL